MTDILALDRVLLQLWYLKNWKSAWLVYEDKDQQLHDSIYDGNILAEQNSP